MTDKKSLKWIGWTLFLTGILVIVCCLALATGPAGIPLNEMMSLFLEQGLSPEKSILIDVRLPRVLLGIAVGGALSISGVLLQGMFRNPLVEPYTLGISGGAALGVCLAIVLKLNRIFPVLTLPLCGFLGSITVMGVVYFLSLKRGIVQVHGMLLTGVMISFVSSSLIMLIMAVSRTEDLHGIIFWTMGFLGESRWPLVFLMLTVSLLGLVLSYFFCFDLNAFSLGEEEAIHLGIKVESTKRLLFLLASILTGLSVSVAGIIGFVGLVVPHFVRTVIGADHRILIIGAYLLGAGFLVFCDTMARTVISPLELPVGVVTGIVGGSVFIYTLTRRELIMGR